MAADAEICLCGANSFVFNVAANNWASLGDAEAIGLYFTTSTNFYRIVTLNSDGTAPINCQITKDFAYSKLSDNFYRQNSLGMV